MIEDAEPSHDAEEEADSELSIKVATVLGPIMKKLKKQSKRIEVIEEAMAHQAKSVADRLPVLESQIHAFALELEDGLECTRRELGERVLHVDHARTHLGLSSSVTQLQQAAEGVQARLAQEKLLRLALEARLDESEASHRRAVEVVEERFATLRSTVSDEAARGDSRWSELQLHVAEVSARVHAELVEAHRETDAELHRLASGLAAAAKQSETLERLTLLEEKGCGLNSRVDRLAAQLRAIADALGEVQASARTQAQQADLIRLRAEVQQRTSSIASVDEIKEVVRELQAREVRWERRHLAVEHSAVASMREVRQMATNLDDLGARLGNLALATEIDELRERISRECGPKVQQSLSPIARQATLSNYARAPWP